ncbi:MAG: hypothetical protein ACO294_11385, partial [Methylococcales bacterium]
AIKPKVGIAASAEPVIKNFLREMLFVAIHASLVVCMVFYTAQVSKEEATRGWLLYNWWVGRDWLRRNFVFELPTNGYNSYVGYIH